MVRYDFYQEWKNYAYKEYFSLEIEKIRIVKETKSLMRFHILLLFYRRLSTENIKPIGREMSKLIHSNPLIVFDIIIDQIQVFDNFIAPVVDSLKYISDFGYDALIGKSSFYS